MKVHSNRVSAMEIEKGGNLMFSGSRDGYLMVWRLPECTCKKVHEEEIFSIRAFGDNLLASAGYDNKIVVWQQANKGGAEQSPSYGSPKKKSLIISPELDLYFVKIININAEFIPSRSLFITSMVPYSIIKKGKERNDIVGNLLIVATKDDFIEIHEAESREVGTPGVIQGNKHMRIYYKKSDKVEKKVPDKKIEREKTKEQLKTRPAIKKICRSGTIKIKETEAENENEDFDYPVALLAQQI